MNGWKEISPEEAELFKSLGVPVEFNSTRREAGWIEFFGRWSPVQYHRPNFRWRVKLDGMEDSKS